MCSFNFTDVIKGVERRGEDSWKQKIVGSRWLLITLAMLSTQLCMEVGVRVDYVRKSIRTMGNKKQVRVNCRSSQ